MLSHKQVWNAIDTIAERYGYSASGLAKKSGLDPTSFNPSKRHGPDGRPRYTVVVYVVNGGQGGRIAVPIAAQMTKWMAQQEAVERRAAERGKTAMTGPSTPNGGRR